MIEIIPAILEQAPEPAADKLKKAAEFAKTVQIDVADGQLVANQTVAIEYIKDAAAKASVNVEWHLMVKDPFASFQDLRDFGDGKNLVIAHLEAQPNFQSVIDQASRLGLKPALALNPATAIKLALPFAAQVEFITLLGIVPGFQGRPMAPGTLERIGELRRLAPDAVIEIDGGVKKINIDLVAQAGVNRIVVGSALWKSVDPKIEFAKLTNLANKV